MHYNNERERSLQVNLFSIKDRVHFRIFLEPHEFSYDNKEKSHTKETIKKLKQVTLENSLLRKKKKWRDKR